MKPAWLHSIQLGVFAVLLVCAGCGPADSSAVTAETDDPVYVQGKQLQKQGRTPEALAAFLKVIEKRGEQSSAESHLDAGIIYLKESKDPVEAYHHFRQYLALQPNSRQAPYVRELIENARREFARTLPAQSLENQSPSAPLEDQVSRLQKENDELRAKLEGFRGDAIMRIPHTTLAPVGNSAPEIHAAILAEQPGPVEAAPLDAGSPISAAPILSTETPANSGAGSPRPAAAAALRPASPGRTTAATPAASARKHRVVAGDTLFNLAKKYYGAGSAAKARAIFEANRDVMRSESDLHPGMEIKIP